MEAWVTVCLMMWAAGHQSSDANQQEVTCHIPAVKVGENTTLTCRFPGNVTRSKISIQKYHRGSIGAPIPILDCNNMDTEPDCRHHDWRSTFDQTTMITDDEVMIEMPEVGSHDEREYKCQIPGYVHDAPCTFKLDTTATNDNAPPSNGNNTAIIVVVVSGVVLLVCVIGLAGGYVYIRRFKKSMQQQRYVQNVRKVTQQLEEGTEEARALVDSEEEKQKTLKDEKSILDSRLVALKSETHGLRQETKDVTCETEKLKLEKEEMIQFKEDLDKIKQERQELEKEKEELLNTLDINKSTMPELQNEVDKLSIKVKDYDNQQKDLRISKDDYERMLKKMREMDAEKTQLETDKAELDKLLKKNATETKKMLDASGGLIGKFTKKKKEDEWFKQEMYQGMCQSLHVLQARNAELETKLQKQDKSSVQYESAF